MTENRFLGTQAYTHNQGRLVLRLGFGLLLRLFLLHFFPLFQSYAWCELHEPQPPALIPVDCKTGRSELERRAVLNLCRSTKLF